MSGKGERFPAGVYKLTDRAWPLPIPTVDMHSAQDRAHSRPIGPAVQSLSVWEQLTPGGDQGMEVLGLSH